MAAGARKKHDEGAAFARRRVFAIVACLALVAPGLGCAEARPITVFAASSLIDALNQVADAYAKAGHVRPVFSFAASSVLARQIEQGARADLYVSADVAWMAYMAQRKLIVPASRVSLLGNTLVLVAPHSSAMNLKITPGFDLLGALDGGKLAMGDPANVPAGVYAKAALQSLEAWSAVASSVALAENVRAALRFVETGDAAAGIVYGSDALAAGDRVRLVGEFPETSHPKISYPMALVRGGQPEAKAFAAFLHSQQARAIFKRLGFTPL
jgi:molybdate transport system substrate-binding protein